MFCSILERTLTTLHIRDLLDSVLKPWEAKCWRMHLSVTQSPYELSITCTVLETFQFSDIVTCQLCFFAQAVILSRHQVYLCKELCVLERKFTRAHNFYDKYVNWYKATEKRATKTSNLLCNIATRWVEKLRCAFYHEARVTRDERDKKKKHH